MTPVEIRAKYAQLIQPPYAGWTQRAVSCFHHKSQELKHGPLIAVQISKGPNWWTLDDLLREPLGQVQEKTRDRSVYFVGNGGWYSIQLANLPKVVEYLTQAGVVDRLRVRELTDPAGCSHRRCRALANSSSEMEVRA